MIHSLIPRTLAVVAILAAGAAQAVAQEVAQTPSISGNSWLAIGILIGAVVLIGVMISGALSVSKIDDTPPDADQGIGVFEGIEEDDDRPRR